MNYADVDWTQANCIGTDHESFIVFGVADIDSFLISNFSIRWIRDWTAASRAGMFKV